MDRFLGRYSPFIYAVLRFVAGLLFWMHGASKLFAWPIGMRNQVGVTVDSLGSLLGVAAMIEFVGGLMIMTGFRASWAAFIASGEMASAYFIRQFPVHPWPIFQVPGVLGGETVLNSFLFLYIASKGSGLLSLDSLFNKARRGLPDPGIRAAHGTSRDS